MIMGTGTWLPAICILRIKTAMRHKEKKQKPEFVDDGRTIANMDYENITGYKSAEERKKHEELRSLNLSKRERKALYKASMAQFLPAFFCFIAAFTLIFVALYFFMRG